MSDPSFTLWKAWTSGPSGEFGPRLAMQAWLAREVAKRLRTSVGPDDDVRWQGRLVSVAPFVPMDRVMVLGAPERAAGAPSDQHIEDALSGAATMACLAIRAA